MSEPLYWEVWDDPSGGGMDTAISMEDGGATTTYQLYGTGDPNKESYKPPSPQQVSSFFDYLLGGTSNLNPSVTSAGTADAGKVVRTLPCVHPFRSELSVSAVESCTGAGKQYTADAIQIDGLRLITEQYPTFHTYQYKVKFSKRPYFLLPNDRISIYSNTYYPPDGGPGVEYQYADEWRRFTVTNRLPSPEAVSAKVPVPLTFKTASGVTPLTGSQCDAQSSLYLQNSTVEIDWFQVPYRYMLDFGPYRSYLTRFVGTVNLWDWNGFERGSLLYLGATPQAYIPSTPKSADRTRYLEAGLDQSLVMNVKLRFLHTARQGTDIPPPTSPLFTNKNNVAAGHNLLPNYETKRFHYVVGGLPTTPDPLRNATNPAFPFELFFTDPLYLQPSGPI